jgi:hypothetical protein
MALVLVGFILLACACFFSYRSGCVFDDEQGYGDPVRGQLYDLIAGLLLLGEIGSFALAALFSCRRHVGQAVAVAAAVVILAGPVSMYIVFFEAGVRGIVACQPA